MDRYELAWAAGFFDGEGWANAVGQAGRTTRQPQARVNQAGPNGVPEVLLRFRRALGGVGRIRGPRIAPGRQALYSWEVSSRPDVELVQHHLRPWLGGVKLNEFSVALGRPVGESRAPSQASEWRAWAGGLFDGEGSLYLLDHRTHDGFKVAEMCVTQASNAGLPEVLRRFALIVGRGNLNGPYIAGDDSHNQPVYRWKSAARADIEMAVASMWPWLSEVKRDQARTVLATIQAQPTLPRGNPQWGNRKTHCVNGHEYATARIRPFVSRNGGGEGRPSSACLACLREYARRIRAQRKSAADDGRRQDLQ